MVSFFILLFQNKKYKSKTGLNCVFFCSKLQTLACVANIISQLHYYVGFQITLEKAPFKTDTSNA